MRRIHIIGGKNHGKTTLIAKLVEELSKSGHRVGTIKHTHHEHELDTPGKDSHQHREAGAAFAGILSSSLNAVFWHERKEPTVSRHDSRYDAFNLIFAGCSIVIVEGDTQTTAPKIEVWRSSLGSPPLAKTDRSIIAVVSDDFDPDIAVPVWPRSDVFFLGEKIIDLYETD